MGLTLTGRAVINHYGAADNCACLQHFEHGSSLSIALELISLETGVHTKSPFSLNLSVVLCIHAHTRTHMGGWWGSLFSFISFVSPAQTRTAICCSWFTLHHNVWLKTSCQVDVPSPESLIGFHEHSWIILRLSVRGCCDMGTGDETGLPLQTNSTTFMALSTAAQDDTRATGLYWVLLRLLSKSGQGSGNVQPAGQQKRRGPMERRQLGWWWWSQ